MTAPNVLVDKDVLDLIEQAVIERQPGDLQNDACIVSYVATLLAERQPRPGPAGEQLDGLEDELEASVTAGSMSTQTADYFKALLRAEVGRRFIRKQRQAEKAARFSENYGRSTL